MGLFAFDGTFGSRKGEPGRWAPEDTNVVKFFDAYWGEKAYYEGVGNEEDNGPLMKALGGVFGAGGHGIVEQACLDLAGQIRDSGTPEHIDIVGYSRGAALAIHFANVITTKGVPDLSSFYKRRVRVSHARVGGKRRPRWETMSGYTRYHKIEKIRFLGLWDMVAAFGIPVDIGPIPTGDINLGYELTKPRNAYACHAMALDERRPPFPVQRVPGAVEAWFRGVHNNVGGNFKGDDGLSDITLLWMVWKAAARGAEFDYEVLEGLGPDPLGRISPQKGDAPRVDSVRPNDRVHESVDPDGYPQLAWDDLRTDRGGIWVPELV